MSRDTVALWKRLNPDHCPECYCRPGKAESGDGTDHEPFCSRSTQ